MLCTSLINRKWHLLLTIYLEDQQLKIAELNIQLQSRSTTQNPRRWYSVCCWRCHSRLSSAVFVSPWESCIHTSRTQTLSQLIVKWVIPFRSLQQGAPHPPQQQLLPTQVMYKNQGYKYTVLSKKFKDFSRTHFPFFKDFVQCKKEPWVYVFFSSFTTWAILSWRSFCVCSF